MPATLEELQAQRAALKKAMRSGASQVRHGDKAVTYRSIEEMKAALDDLEDEIAAVEGTKRKRVFYVRAGRGY